MISLFRSSRAFVLPAVVALLVFVPTSSFAKSVSFETNKTPGEFGYASPDHYDYTLTLTNIDYRVSYYATIVTDNGTQINDGSQVPVGTHLTLAFTPHQPADIYWFGTGGTSDSPTGQWISGAGTPAYGCFASDKVNNTPIGYTDQNNHQGTFNAFIPLTVNPPQETINAGANLNCGTPNTAPDGTVSEGCTVSGAGPIHPVFSTAQTYLNYYDLYQIVGQSGCYTYAPNGTKLDAMYNECSLYLQYCSPSEYPYLSHYGGGPVNDIVPPQTISFSFTGTGGASPPTAPVVTATAGTTCSNTNYTFNATDSGDTIKYGVDSDNNGTVDAWIPASGYVASGTTEPWAKLWTTTGVHTIEVLAENSHGIDSGWTSKQVTIGACVAPPVATLTNNGPIISGSSANLAWSCTGNNTSASIAPSIGSLSPTGGVWSGSVPTPNLTSNTTYTLTCTGPGGNGTDTSTVTVNTTPPDLTAALVPGQNPLHGTVGVPVSVEAQVSNIGTGPTNIPFWTTFWVADPGGANRRYFEFPSGIPNGFNSGVSEIDPVTPNTVQFTFDTPGTYVYRACADRDQNMVQTVPQSNTANDCSTWGKIIISAPTPTCSLTVSPEDINQGDSANISWSSTNATSCSGSGFDTGGATAGGPVSTGPLNENTAYGLECTGYGGAECDATPQIVIVEQPTATLSANPTRVGSGDTTALTWSSTLADSCSMTRNGVTWTTPGTRGKTSGSNVTDNKPITEQTTYILDCTGAIAQAVVNIDPAFKNY
jgi:plastocyanin